VQIDKLRIKQSTKKIDLHQGLCRLLRCRLAAEEVEAGGHLVSLNMYIRVRMLVVERERETERERPRESVCEREREREKRDDEYR
jgi:hypothetical protein